MVADAVAPMVARARRAVADALAVAAKRGADPGRGPGRQACEHSGGTDDRDPPWEQSRGDPAMPELASAVGAARLAAARAGASRQTVIGGGITRGLLSPLPLAVVAALLGAVLMTLYAVGTTLAGREVPGPVEAPTVAEQPSMDRSSAVGATTLIPAPTRTTADAAVLRVSRTEPSWTDTPGWATIELPPPEASSTTTLRPAPPADDGVPKTTLVPPPLRPETSAQAQDRRRPDRRH